MGNSFPIFNGLSLVGLIREKQGHLTNLLPTINGVLGLTRLARVLVPGYPHHILCRGEYKAADFYCFLSR